MSREGMLALRAAADNYNRQHPNDPDAEPRFVRTMQLAQTALQARSKRLDPVRKRLRDRLMMTAMARSGGGSLHGDGTGMNAPGWKGGGGRLSPQQIAQAAKAAGFRGQALVLATAVAMGESGGNVGAHNPRGEDSRGLWQINMDPKLGRRYDRQKLLTDPVYNARVAFEISGGGKNFSPWTVFSGGSYKQYLNAAQQAASAVGFETGGELDFGETSAQSMAGKANVRSKAPRRDGAPGHEDNAYNVQGFATGGQLGTGGMPTGAPDPQAAFGGQALVGAFQRYVAQHPNDPRAGDRFVAIIRSIDEIRKQLEGGTLARPEGMGEGGLLEQEPSMIKQLLQQQGANLPVSPFLKDIFPDAATPATPAPAAGQPVLPQLPGSTNPGMMTGGAVPKTSAAGVAKKANVRSKAPKRKGAPGHDDNAYNVEGFATGGGISTESKGLRAMLESLRSFIDESDPLFDIIVQRLAGMPPEEAAAEIASVPQQAAAAPVAAGANPYGAEIPGLTGPISSSPNAAAQYTAMGGKGGGSSIDLAQRMRSGVQLGGAGSLGGKTLPKFATGGQMQKRVADSNRSSMEMGGGKGKNPLVDGFQRYIKANPGDADAADRFVRMMSSIVELRRRIRERMSTSSGGRLELPQPLEPSVGGTYREPGTGLGELAPQMGSGMSDDEMLAMAGGGPGMEAPAQMPPPAFGGRRPYDTGGAMMVEGKPHYIVEGDTGRPVAEITEDGKPEMVKGEGGVEVIPMDPVRNANYHAQKAAGNVEPGQPAPMPGEGDSVAELLAQLPPEIRERVIEKLAQLPPEAQEDPTIVEQVIAHCLQEYGGGGGAEQAPAEAAPPEFASGGMIRPSAPQSGFRSGMQNAISRNTAMLPGNAMARTNGANDGRAFNGMMNNGRPEFPGADVGRQNPDRDAQGVMPSVNGIGSQVSGLAQGGVNGDALRQRIAELIRQRVGGQNPMQTDSQMQSRMGAQRGDGNYRGWADVNRDGIIDDRDLELVAQGGTIKKTMPGAGLTVSLSPAKATPGVGASSVNEPLPTHVGGADSVGLPQGDPMAAQLIAQTAPQQRPQPFQEGSPVVTDPNQAHVGPVLPQTGLPPSLMQQGVQPANALMQLLGSAGGGMNTDRLRQLVGRAPIPQRGRGFATGGQLGIASGGNRLIGSQQTSGMPAFGFQQNAPYASASRQIPNLPGVEIAQPWKIAPRTMQNAGDLGRQLMQAYWNASGGNPAAFMEQAQMAVPGRATTGRTFY